MKLTLLQWITLRRLQHEAAIALEALENECLRLCTQEFKKLPADSPEVSLLKRLRKAGQAAEECLYPFNLEPQGEWMGGPTSGPGSENTKTYLREPHAAGLGSARRYFTKAEIAKVKNLGLLQGDYDGPEK
jgi:hypothetical protein